MHTLLLFPSLPLPFLLQLTGVRAVGLVRSADIPLAHTSMVA